MRSLVLLSSSMGCQYGGTETFVRTIAGQLIGKVPDIRLVSGGSPATFIPDYHRLTGSATVRECHFPLLDRHSLPGRLLGSSRLGQKLCPADLEALSSLFSRHRISRFVHGAELAEAHYPLEGLLFPAFPPEMAKILHFHGAWPSPLFRKLSRYILAHTDCCVACSGYARSELLKTLPAMPVEVVYNGVDLDLFSPGESAFVPTCRHEPHRLKVGTVARLSRDKGSDLLCRVAATMEEEIELFLAGPLDSGFAVDLKKYAHSPNIHYIGPLEHGRIADFYRFLDCFVLPSRFEAFPLTLLEAMACSTGVIGSRVGGIPEMIGQHGEAGLYMEPDDEPELRSHLRRLGKDRETLRLMGERGRARVVQHFSLHKTTADMLTLYQNVLEKRNSTTRGLQ